jgi:hypothetical protein
MVTKGTVFSKDLTGNNEYCDQVMVFLTYPFQKRENGRINSHSQTDSLRRRNESVKNGKVEGEH